MVSCADVCVVTKRGYFFTVVPLDLLEECNKKKAELLNEGWRKIVFEISITDLEDGTEQDFEATDLLVKIGS